MRNRPLISVCIINYNYGRFLRESVTAALGQTYPNIEVIVSDNASTDESMRVLEELAHDTRLRVFQNEKNIGWMRNMERSLSYAQGEYVVSIPSDDLLLPHFIEDAYAFLERHRATTDAVYSSVVYTDVTLQPKKSGSCPGLLPGAYSGGRNEFRELLNMDHIRWPALLAPRDILQRYTKYDGELHVQADWDALLQMAANGVRFGYIPQTGVLIRTHEEQCSGARNFAGSFREIEDYLTIHERFVTAEHHWRFYGTETLLLNNFNHFYTCLEAASTHPFSLPLQQRAERYRAHLKALANATPPKRHASQPMFSVILTTNGTRLEALSQALRSIHAQEESSFEIIVIQSGGESLEDWLSTQPFAIQTRFFYSSHNMTFGQARNIGVRLSNGEYIAYLDEGAEFTPQHLSTMRNVFEATSAPAACANTAVRVHTIASDGLFGVGPSFTSPEIAPTVPASALVHRYSCISQSGLFPEQLNILEDWSFFLKLATSVGMTSTGEISVIVDIPQALHGSRYDSIGIHQYLAIVDMIYSAMPPATHEQKQLRQQYREQVLATWPSPYASPEETMKFLAACAGKIITMAAAAV